ncbi:hypothetical protein EMPS_01887 [Entomortierella parvispora]|uniref:Uncharacterized protein n=1 Tax=Entomortierella parvispora TaxID=205924 RepID=A0A9P3H3R7_9FUNG|nr:hypothetical protein EMPS_01887 [Entomortierella parvispora]
MEDRTTRILTRAKELANRQRNRVAPQSARGDARMPDGHIPHDSLPMQEKTMGIAHDRSLQNISIHQFEQPPQLQQQQQEQQREQEQQTWQQSNSATHNTEITNALHLKTSPASLRAYQAHQDPERQHPLDVGPPVPSKDFKGKGVIPGGMGSTGQLPPLPGETLTVSTTSTTHIPVSAEGAMVGGSTDQRIQAARESPANDAPCSPVADHLTRLRDHARIFPRPRSSSSLSLSKQVSCDSMNTVSSISTQTTRLSMSRGEIGYMSNRTLKDLRGSNGNIVSPRSHSTGNIAAYASTVPPQGSFENEKQLDEHLRAIRRRSYSNNSLNECRSTEDMFRPEGVSNFTPNNPVPLRTTVSSPALDAIRRSSVGIKNVITTWVSTPTALSESGSSSFSSSTYDGSTLSLEDHPTSTGELSQYQIQSQEAFVPLSLSLDPESLGDSSSFTPEDGESQQKHQPNPFALSLDTKGAFRPRTKSISSSKSSNSMATLGPSPSLPSQLDPPAATAIDKEDETSYPTLTKDNQARLSKYRSGQLPYPPPPPISPTGTSFSRTPSGSKELLTKVGVNSDIIERSARMEDDDNVGFKKQLNTSTKGRVPSFEVISSRIAS